MQAKCRLKKKYLKKSLVAASVAMFPSYSDIRGKSVYSQKLGEVNTGHHTMLLVGHDIDKFGRYFWEFQDSYGKKCGGGGVDMRYIRVAKGCGLVREFVEFKFRLPISQP